MLLSPWLNRLVSKLSVSRARWRRVQQWKRDRREALSRCVSMAAMSPQAEGLEERVLLTSLRWVGDVGADWNTQTVGGDTNWSDDLLPQDGDTLIFDDSSSGTVTNNTGEGLSYTLLFESGNYIVNGDSITLDNADK